MIITPDIFEIGLAIGQVEKPQVAARIQWYIDEHEPKYLKKLLGKELAQLFEQEYAKETHDEKWDKLAADVRPMAARYVYYHYHRKNETITTGIGEEMAQAENAVRTTISYKIVDVWNEMVEMSLNFCQDINRTIYPEYAGYIISDIYNFKNTFGI
jgi:hypothetical protein